MRAAITNAELIMQNAECRNAEIVMGNVNAAMGAVVLGERRRMGASNMREYAGIARVDGVRFSVDVGSNACDSERDVRDRQRFLSTGKAVVEILRPSHEGKRD